MTSTAWIDDAEPQTPEEVLREPLCPEVVEAATDRGITSIVHFTRITGLVGILASSAVISRRRLPEEALLRHVFEENAADRSRDEIWHDYVNLSVSVINDWMFKKSKKWHPDDDWVILEFGPQILGDRGVVFCTTNNAYPNSYRSRGIAGFEQMFVPEVPFGYYGTRAVRSGLASHRTTHRQAEVLYPFELSLEHLRTIKTPDDGLAIEAVDAALSAFPHDHMVEADPEAFR